MPRIEQTIQIQAPIRRVYEIARDVEAFPEFMADLKALRVLSRSDDNARTVTEWSRLYPRRQAAHEVDAGRCVGRRRVPRRLYNDTRRLETHGRLLAVYGRERNAQTRFDSVVDYDIDIPMIGPMIKSLVKKLMTDNLQATLNAIKNRAEQSRS